MYMFNSGVSHRLAARSMNAGDFTHTAMPDSSLRPFLHPRWYFHEQNGPYGMLARVYFHKEACRVGRADPNAAESRSPIAL